MQNKVPLKLNFNKKREVGVCLIKTINDNLSMST